MTEAELASGAQAAEQVTSAELPAQAGEAREPAPAGDLDDGSKAGDKDRGARQPEPDAERSEESADNYVFEDMLRPSGRQSAVVDSVRAQASFVGSTHIHSVTISSNHGRYQVPLSDLTALHARAEFTPPPGYQDLVQALASPQVVICCGPNGCGKELAITRALEQAGRKTIRLLPGSLNISEMSRVIDAERGTGGAFVLPAANEAWLRSLAGPPGQSIRSSASREQITIIAVTASEPGSSLARSFRVVRLGYPDAAAVLAGYADARNLPDAVRQLAGTALEQVPAPVSPAVIEAVLSDAAARPTNSATEIASSFTNAVSAEAIAEWMAEGRQPGEVAVVAAGATLSGEPDIVVHEQADRLQDRLEVAEQRDQQPKLLSGGTSWPAGLLESAVDRAHTHFGVQPVQVVQVAAPHRPQDVVLAVWQTLGPWFRSEYCEWLVDLPGAGRLRWHAAYTAGVLLTADPVLIEERVLRRWLNSQVADYHRCAGLALGAPIAIGADPATAHRLAHAWASSDAIRLRRAAIAAYGGLLGAWDAPSAAPLKLFVIGELTPELRPEADGALARLVVAGADAVGARTATINYLKLTLANRPSKSRIFGCLPGIIQALVQPFAVCAESLAALRTEHDNWRDLLGLVATAMVEPAGLADGQRCLAWLVRAGARGNLDHDVIEEAIRAMRDSRRPLGSVSRLGSAIRRTLAALSRSDDEEVTATAAALLQRFFN